MFCDLVCIAANDLLLLCSVNSPLYARSALLMLQGMLAVAGEASRLQYLNLFAFPLLVHSMKRRSNTDLLVKENEQSNSEPPLPSPLPQA